MIISVVFVMSTFVWLQRYPIIVIMIMDGEFRLDYGKRSNKFTFSCNNYSFVRPHCGLSSADILIWPCLSANPSIPNACFYDFLTDFDEIYVQHHAVLGLIKIVEVKG